jgi:hypothetical protein
MNRTRDGGGNGIIVPPVFSPIVVVVASYMEHPGESLPLLTGQGEWWFESFNIASSELVKDKREVLGLCSTE